MDLKSTFDIILKDLEEAREIMDQLKNYPDIPDIRIEMAKAKCRSAEEVLKFISEKDFCIAGKENTVYGKTVEEKAEATYETPDLIDDIVQPGNKIEEENIGDKKDKQGKIMADKFIPHSSINESMAQSRHDDKDTETGKLKPVNSLTEAIGINDRFLFVRELFNGNQELYKLTIENLNNAGTIDEAYDILSEASKSNKESETFDIMLDLVKRKLRKK